MKSCPMCGTLLFDDAEKCTKCGRALSEEGEAPEAAKEPSEDKANEAAESTATEADTTTSQEASAKRKKWLEEQEKIRSELASIMGRVGKKRKPLVPTVPTQAASYPGPVAATPQQPTVQVPKPTSPVPATPTTPVSPVPQATPSQVQPVTVTQSANRPFPQGPQQTPGQVGNTPAAAAPQEGLSEINKNELLRELDDLQAEGYNVSKLEKIIEESPGIAWKAFSDFLDDIEKLNQQKERLEKINTGGFEDFEIEKKQLLSKMIDPELLTNYETEITQLENKFLAAKSEEEEKVAAEVEVNKKKSDQVTALIAAGKEAFRIKQYQSAMDIFDQAYALTPDNKEITFFKKKIETKLMEEASEPQAAAGEPGFEEAGVAPEPGEKKKKKKKKKKMLFRRSTPEAEEPVGPGVPVSTQAQPDEAAGVAQGQGVGVGVAPNQPAAVRPSPNQAAAKPVTPQPAAAAPPSAAPQPAEAAEGGGDGPRSAAEFEALGFNAYINKDYPKALEFYEKVLQIDPNFPNVQNIIDECLMRLGKK